MATLLNQKLLKSCVEKFNFPENQKRQRIDEIISAWQTAFKDHDLSKAKETSLQGKFFSKFFCEILGYTMQDDGQEVWTLKQEAKTEVDGKEADGSLGYYSKISAKTRCVIEQSRESKQTPVEQAFQYLYKFADCDWVIVSNFRYTRLYHKSKGQTAYEEFDILNLHEEKEFKRFYYCLCKENLLNENSCSQMDLLIKQSGEADIDITKEFYAEFKTVRKILFEHIVENNPDFDKKLLLEKTQKLLDRFIFIFFCEDTAGLLPHNTVENIYKMAQNSFSLSECKIWEQFRGLFVAIDKGNNNVNPPINAYNGGLFAYDEILDKLIIKDEMFTYIKELARYDFESDLNVNILGHIFEQSLSDLEQIKNELDGIQEDKKNSKRKKDGIFYTPEYITHYIVEETIGKYLEENPDKLETIKILDPACGSGAFLNQAHSFLLKQRQIQVEENIKNNDKSQLNLFKHTNQAEHDRSIKTANSKCKLNNLDENIKCGNSLIDDETIAGDKAFKWENEYKDIMQNGGFDVIIGNPPYVFTRNQNFTQEEKDFYYNRYQLIDFQINTYLLFIEMSINLLKTGGYLSFIVPNNWLTLDTFQKFRKYLFENFGNIEIVTICDKVFEDANVDCCILRLKKIQPNSIILKETIDRHIETIGTFENNFFKKNNYIVNTKLAKSINNIEILNKINLNSFKISEIASVKAGVKVYEVGAGKPKQTKEMKEQRIYHSMQKEDSDWFKYIEGVNVSRYLLSWNGIWVKYGENLSRKRESRFFNSERILVRQIPSKLPYCINAISTDEEYVNDLNSMIIVDFKFNPLYILSILNSRLISFWFINTFDKLQRGIFPQFKIKELEIFPVYKATEEQQNSLSQKAERMIELNKSLQEETQKALELIELEYKPKKISQNLLSFYTLGLNPFIEELEKQGVKLSLTQKEDLISWYKTKSDQLNKIKSEIDTLDRQIDQEVYKLYNLTPEEIQIIEGVG